MSRLDWWVELVSDFWDMLDHFWKSNKFGHLYMRILAFLKYWVEDNLIIYKEYSMGYLNAELLYGVRERLQISRGWFTLLHCLCPLSPMSHYRCNTSALNLEGRSFCATLRFVLRRYCEGGDPNNFNSSRYTGVFKIYSFILILFDPPWIVSREAFSKLPKNHLDL